MRIIPNTISKDSHTVEGSNIEETDSMGRRKRRLKYDERFVFSVDKIVLEFRGRPISKDNEKLISKYSDPKTGRHWTFLSTKYKIYEKNLKRQAWAQLPVGWKPLTDCVWVSLFFYFKNKVHTDVINLPKSICDAMTGMLWKNDKQVWLKQVRPLYGKNQEEGFDLILEKVINGNQKR